MKNKIRTAQIISHSFSISTVVSPNHHHSRENSPAVSFANLYTGSGFMGTKQSNCSGTTSAILWRYDNLKGERKGNLLLDELKECITHDNAESFPPCDTLQLRVPTHLMALSSTSMMNLALGCIGSSWAASSQSSQDHLNWKLLKW